MARGPWWWALEVVAPRPPNWAEVPAQAASSRAANLTSLQLGHTYFPGTGTPGRLLVSGQQAAKADLRQNTGSFPPSTARGWDFSWEPDPASQAFRKVRLSVRPEATRELFAAGPFPLNLTTFSIPNESWT
ncbi:hypothetical protein llap_9739 [Limosa lapponica baueri]|uniref:Uncharacterized protein n=1 Tax=Limosa lapponica baueri TaxID=1758121 RepID=A0A2I0U1K1_LIMLA|nr:hypothetical protein llap_9739 [Limosa lapponica baueri]